MALQITSPAFKHNTDMPKKYTCQGDDISPELNWKEAPKETKSFVLIVDDPDAPDPQNPKRTWVHWVLYDMPPELSHLKENITGLEKLPEGGVHGITDFQKLGYGGPCPPIGKHRYFFKLYAIDKVLGFPAGKTKSQIMEAIEGHILEETSIIGLYQK